jgi:hypothetical protein
MSGGWLLVVWIGFGQTQTMTIVPFPTQAECEGARHALVAWDSGFDDRWVACLPYTPLAPPLPAPPD